MKKQKTSKALTVFILAVTILVGLGGCTKEIEKAHLPIPDIVWPPAPEIPRIRFINAVSKPQDLHIKRGAFKKFFDYLTGKTAVSMIAPYSVKTDSAGRLYTVDTFLRTVLVFDVKDNAYYPFSTDKSKLMSPIDVAMDENRGTTYVTDSQGGVVKIFEDRGQKWVGEIGKGVLERPTGIAVHPDTSELIVVDTKLANIFRYDLSNHQLKGKFGVRGSADGQLNYPTHVCVTGDGNIFVTDALNFRIQVFSAEGKFLKKFGRAGDIPVTLPGREG